MSNKLATNANQSAKEPISRAGPLPEPPYNPYGEEPTAPAYRPYAEKPALSEPPYEPYKDI
jgi:hypothetical protein